MGELDKPDPQQLRISDDDRHKVADILRDAAGDGRIDFEELDERLEATYADLVPITLDLPTSSLAVPVTPSTPATAQPTSRGTPSPVVAGPDSSSHVAIMGSLERNGHWIVPRQLSVFAMMGGANLACARPSSPTGRS